MSELEVFNSLKEKFPNAEIDWVSSHPGDTEVTFAVTLADFANVYKKDMSSVKYEAITGEYWIDGKEWKLTTRNRLYTSFDKYKLKPVLPDVKEKKSEDKELEELVNYIDPWIENKDTSKSSIEEVLCAIAMSKQDQLLIRVLKNIRSSSSNNQN